MEHARRSIFATEALLPMGGRSEALLLLAGRHEKLLPPMAKPLKCEQFTLTDLSQSSESLFATILKSIYRRPFGSHFLSLSHVVLYFYASNIDHPFTTRQHLSSARYNRHGDYSHYQGVTTHHWQQPISQQFGDARTLIWSLSVTAQAADSGSPPRDVTRRRCPRGCPE